MLYLYHNAPIDRAFMSFDSDFRLDATTEWFDNDIVRHIITTIDKNEVLGPESYKSPVFNLIGPDMLSGGTKCLIWMLNNPGRMVPMWFLADNCAEGLRMISDIMDCHLSYDNYMIVFDALQVATTPKGTVCRGDVDIQNMLIKEGSR